MPVSRCFALVLLAGSLALPTAAAAASPAPERKVSSRLSGIDCPDGRVSAWTGSRAIFYVSPKGRDDWSGGLSHANAQDKDGPLATIEKARDLARASGKPAAIVLDAGDYYLGKPVVFGPKDAGLVVTAGCDGAPILHGGPLIAGWKAAPGGRWTAPLALPGDDRVGDLFVDGVIQTEARYPNAASDGDPRKGWLFAAPCMGPAEPWQGNTRFCFHAGDLPPLNDLTGLAAHIVGGFQPGSQWGSDTLPVTAIDRDRRIVHTRGTSYFFTAEGSRYFLSGTEALLDAPHEWWFDAPAGKLEYIAGDPSFDGTGVVAGILPTFFELDGAAGMVVSGLRFADGAPQGSGKYGTDTRGGGAIRLSRSDGVRLTGNVIENVGVGIHVSESRNVVIADNDIGPVAGNGIYLGTAYGSFGKSSDARIVRNHIHDIGRVYFESAGIWFQAADDVKVARNLIENAAQFGIAGGSLWGAQDSVHDAVIEYNLIRNANQQTADGGAIKLMGEQADLMASSIRFNVVIGTRQLMNRQDGTFWPSDYENTREWPTPISWAIYTDGKASGVRIEGNVLWDNVSGIGINGGWNNMVTGNVIARGSGAAFRVDDGTGRNWHPPWARANRIEDNTVSIGSKGGLALSVYAPGHGAGYVEFARNRYSGNLNGQSFEIRPALMASGELGSLRDLQAAGQEKGSVVMSPAQHGH